MAAKTPLFRRKFPLLVTSSLLAIQTFSASAASEQFACQVSASGQWDCSAAAPSQPLPPRPTQASTQTEPLLLPKQPAKTKVETPLAESSESALRLDSTVANDYQGVPSTNDYAILDWVPREQLTAAQLEEISPYCAGDYIEPLRPGMDDKTPADESPLYISAKASRYEQTSDVAMLAGDVVLRQASMQAEAHEAKLYRQENRGELIGGVRLRDTGSLLVGDRAEIQLDTGAAKVENAQYVMHQGRVRGEAQYVKRQEDGIIRLKDGTYTRCTPGSNTWHVRANNITLNNETGFGTGTNVTLRVKDIPVFYTPYIHFPLDDRRVSGFLVPSISYSRRKGAEVTTPYYFNLAPNMDATLYPQLISKRGLLMEGDFRYLSKNSESKVSASWLNDREDERKHQSEYKDTRWLYRLEHTHGLTSRLRADLDYTDLSDPYFFDDLNTSLDISSRNFVDQRGSLTWRGDSFTAGLNAHAYERANISDVTPYNRLPQLTLNGHAPFELAGLDMGYQTELVRFERSLKSDNYYDKDRIAQPWNDNNIQGLARAEGNRLHLEPSISLPLNWSWGYIKPAIKYAYTKYDLTLDSTGKDHIQKTLNNDPNAPRFHSNQSRSVPIYSVDSGLYFDRDAQWFGKNYRQTLEPRLFYLNVPYKDQSDIPVFDTSESTFSYAGMFRDNRFSGRDRIGDTNQFSLGVTNRWIDESGLERQRFSIGQSYYLRDRKVQMPGVEFEKTPESKHSQSPYAMEYMLRFNQDWRLTSDFVWDKNSHSTRSGSLMFHYQDHADLNKIVNFGVRYRADRTYYDSEKGEWVTGTDYGSPGSSDYVKDFYKIKQTDMSVMWPVVPQWSAIARWQYDYNRNRTLDAFAGFEYDSCCWKLRLINRYWLDYDENNQRPNDNREADRGVFLQIVFKGLGSVTGQKIDTFLDEGIKGYREREDQAF